VLSILIRDWKAILLHVDIVGVHAKSDGRQISAPRFRLRQTPALVNKCTKVSKRLCSFESLT
jgi:hypothetical protein